jgi:hypothetical protein
MKIPFLKVCEQLMRTRWVFLLLWFGDCDGG